jgi:hypothetical protein
MQPVTFTADIGEDRIIRVPPEVVLPAGKVEVTVVPQQRPTDPNSPRSLSERLVRLAKEHGDLGLPADLAENHDHYVHGLPKGIDRP